MKFLFYIGTIASFILPFFNIPLILRIIKRKSSDDISLVWVVGVWISIVLMSPNALTSNDLAFRAYGWTNLFFFTGVMFVTLGYRGKSKS